MMYHPSNTPWSPYLPAPITSEEGPLPEAKRGIWPGRYAKVTAFILIAMVVVAIAAAVVGPLVAAQISPTSAPSNWTKAYDSNLQNTLDWTGDGGCYNGRNGLDVSAPTSNNSSDVCTYVPSTTSDLVGQGFQLNLTLSPESQLQNPLTPLVQIGDSSGDGLTAVFDDTGDYVICEGASASSDCSACLPTNLGVACNDSVLVSDSTVAWHTDSYVANTLAIRYQVNSDGSGTISVFANGQEVASSATSVSLRNGGFSIAIGSGDGGEALYTGATLYTASS
jgi:hypothetical protein